MPENGIALPGTDVFGLVRKASSESMSHFMPEAIMARLKRNPGSLPAGRPKTPFRLGPTPLLPSIEWQALHCANAALPAAASWAWTVPSAAAKTNAITVDGAILVGRGVMRVLGCGLEGRCSQHARAMHVRRHVVPGAQRQRRQR